MSQNRSKQELEFGWDHMGYGLKIIGSERIFARAYNSSQRSFDASLPGSHKLSEQILRLLSCCASSFQSRMGKFLSLSKGQEASSINLPLAATSCPGVCVSPTFHMPFGSNDPRVAVRGSGTFYVIPGHFGAMPNGAI